MLSKQSNLYGKPHNDVLYYAAPEAFDGRTQQRSDVWSLSITLLELAEGKNPYADHKAMSVVKAIVEENPPALSTEKWSAEFVDFVNMCLVKDVNERAALRELIDVSGFWQE